MVATRQPETLDLDAETLPLAAEDAAALRAIAKAAPYPRNRLYLVLADLVECDRMLARFGSAPPAGTVARRHELLDQLDAERDKAADSFLSMFALAIDRRPKEVAAMLMPFLVKHIGPVWDHIRDRIETLEKLEAAR